MSNSNSAFEACHVEQNCFEHSKTVAAQHFPCNESVQQQFLPTGSQQHLNYRQRLGGNGGCNVTRPWLYFDYLLRTQFTWESVKLEYTLPWHFYKKETTISFPFPQIFETPLQWPRQDNLIYVDGHQTPLPHLANEHTLAGWRPLPVSVTVSTQDPILIPAGYPIPHSATFLRHPYHTVPHNTEAPIPHSATLLADTNTRSILNCAHRCLLYTCTVESYCRVHSVESTGPNIDISRLPSALLGHILREVA